MTPIKLKNPTRTVGKEQIEYRSLDIVDTKYGTTPVMISYWRPSLDELERLNDGETLKLSILGTVHPPVLVQIGNPDE